MALMNFVLFYEQHQYGSFYKPAFGPNEFLVLVSILYFLLFIFYKSPNFVFQKTTFNNASVITYTTLTVSILYFLRAFVSIKISFRNFIFPILVHLIILIPFYFNRSLSPVIAGSFIIVVNSVFIGKILLTVYSFSAVPRNFFSRLFISPSLLESVITNPEEEIKTERKDTPL